MSIRTTSGLAMLQHRCQEPSSDVFGRLRDGWLVICRLNGTSAQVLTVSLEEEF